MTEKSNRLNFKIPTNPDFNIMDAKKTLFSEETSTCKFKSQKKNGKIGIFMLKIQKLKNHIFSNKLF